MLDVQELQLKSDFRCARTTTRVRCKMCKNYNERQMLDVQELQRKTDVRCARVTAKVRC